MFYYTHEVFCCHVSLNHAVQLFRRSATEKFISIPKTLNSIDLDKKNCRFNTHECILFEN